MHHLAIWLTVNLVGEVLFFSTHSPGYNFKSCCGPQAHIIKARQKLIHLLSSMFFKKSMRLFALSCKHWICNPRLATWYSFSQAHRIYSIHLLYVYVHAVLCMQHLALLSLCQP